MLAQRIDTTITLYSNWGAASAIGVVLMVIALFAVWLTARVVGLRQTFMR
jgi:ABC-type spermidine/putrescine transport system permease subunit I